MPTVQTSQAVPFVASADPLVHAVLSSPETRQEARTIVDALLGALPDGMSLYGLLTALTAATVAVCDDNDIDPEAAFAQIMGTVFRDPETFGARVSLSDVALPS